MRWSWSGPPGQEADGTGWSQEIQSRQISRNRQRSAWPERIVTEGRQYPFASGMDEGNGTSLSRPSVDLPG